MNQSSTGRAPDSLQLPQATIQRWLADIGRWIQTVISLPQVLALVVVIDLAAYFAGLIFWYGYVMADPATPWWAWPFIPDCPLFGLLGGVGLLMAVANQRWSHSAQAEGRRLMWIAGLVALGVWLTTYLPGVGESWTRQGSMFALFSISLLLGAYWFRRPPAWLLGIFVAGQIKYGIWTITAWTLYWRGTAEFFGAPHVTFDGVLMTVSHVGLALQGLLLLTYFRPDWRTVLAVVAWFGLSDFVDYGLGYYPAINEQFTSLTLIQWSTIVVTLLLGAWFALLVQQSRPNSVSDGLDPLR